MFAKVIVDISTGELDRIFDYDIDSLDISRGQRVLVPFGGREVEGYVMDIVSQSDCPPDKIKKIISAIDEERVISEEFFSLCEYMKRRYHLRTVDVLRLFIPAEMRGGKVKELEVKSVEISSAFLDCHTDSFIKKSAVMQLAAYEYLKERGRVLLSEMNKNCSAAAVRNLIMRGIFEVTLENKRRTPYNELSIEEKKVVLTAEQRTCVHKITSGQGKTFLLHGVTGSGKTEVYMACIDDALGRGKTAVMLVPEISLTPQVMRTFRARFGDRVALLHSGLSKGERFDEWQRLRDGRARVAVGARSAIFAPLSGIGVIIVDEEHDSSYNSESNPRYSTIEVAELRRKYNDCNLILGSATPSIESFYFAQRGDYELLTMPNRVNSKPLPEISIVNMCDEIASGNPEIFSHLLTEKLRECIDLHNQAMIFINRRGYSSFVRCYSCGYVAKCERCDVSLVYHRDENGEYLKCHYCGNKYHMLDRCPKCSGEHIKRGYVGTQQVAEYIEKHFPKSRVLRMDNDTTQGKDSHARILKSFGQGDADVLVGTQMIAKGHDFSSVTLVGIVDSDLSLHFSDFRAAERTYQLITQVSGRAGRDKKAGTVVLQTYSPNHYVYRYAVTNNYLGFYEKECNLREVTKFPPFSHIVRVLISSEDEDKVRNTLKNVFGEIKAVSEKSVGSFAFLNYMWSPVRKIKDNYRAQVLMRITENFEEILGEIYAVIDRHSAQKISIFAEINPNNLN